MDINKMLAKPNETIREHTDKLIKQAKLLNQLGYISSKTIYSDLLCACEYHDYGKGNSEFQKRIVRNYRFNSYKEVPHSVLSVFFVDENKCNDYAGVCFAVLYHHYHSDSPSHILYQEEDLIRKYLCEMIGDYDVYDDIDDCADDIGELFSFKTSDEKKKCAVLLKGFLHKCDYSASANIICERPNDFLVESLHRWQSEKTIEFNALQKFCNENSDSNIIVTAPTGMGKTEAGLMWCGNNKCFFVLPLKTAINAMYDRIKKLSGDSYKNRVAIIHSDMKSKYMAETLKNDGEEFDFDYFTRSRQMSLPITVCTPDQIFDFVLKYPGYEYKLATASYSKFIIDEIQMYSPDLLAAIIYAIKLIHNFGGKIAILTATLPPFVRNELYKIFGEDVKTEDFSQYGELRHNVQVTEKILESSDIFDTIQKIKCESVKKFLVVCNSIDTADRLYSELSEMYGDEMEVNLFHAGFIKSDRAKKEEEILRASKNKDKTEIWISTSVVEASLDIDFDILFTELSDLFSLFQRFGRVNRKGKKDFSSTNCYVFTELQGNAKKFHFTDETVYKLSKEAVMTINGVISETEKSVLIDKYLTVENIENSKYYSKYCDALEYFENLEDYLKSKSDGLRNIDRIDAIPKRIYDSMKEQISHQENIIADKESSMEDKLKANEFINNLTVSISRFRATKANTVEYVRTKYSMIPVIKNCEYSSERGIAFTRKDEKNSDVNDTDNFI